MGGGGPRWCQGLESEGMAAGMRREGYLQRFEQRVGKHWLWRSIPGTKHHREFLLPRGVEEQGEDGALQTQGGAATLELSP